MKFLAVLAAAAAFAAAPQSPPRPLVLIVHGRGHAEDDSAALRREWKRSLDAALAAVGKTRIPDADVRLAWYADVLDPGAATACPSRTRPADQGLEAFGTILSALAASLPAGEGREARGLIGDFMYVLDEGRRCAAERRVGSEIERALSTKRPVIVIAYSLGSLVSYGYLKTREPVTGDPEIHFVTIGSPLGIPEMRELLGLGADSLRRPRSLRSWQNIYDPADGLSSPVAPDSVSGLAVDRSTREAREHEAHHIGRYLRDPTMGEVLTRLVNPGSTVRP